MHRVRDALLSRPGMIIRSAHAATFSVKAMAKSKLFDVKQQVRTSVNYVLKLDSFGYLGEAHFLWRIPF